MEETLQHIEEVEREQVIFTVLTQISPRNTIFPTKFINSA